MTSYITTVFDFGICRKHGPVVEQDTIGLRHRSVTSRCRAADADSVNQKPKAVGRHARTLEIGSGLTAAAALRKQLRGLKLPPPVLISELLVTADDAPAA